MPRLLIVCEYPTLLGGERSMLSTLPAVVAAGFDVCVAAPSQGPLADALQGRGIPHMAWETQDGRARRALSRLRDELAQIVHRVAADLVHANSLSTARIAGPVACECGVPSIGHLRDIVKLTASAVADLNAHELLIAVSSATRDFHVAQGLDGGKCVVVHNGVDLETFRPWPPSGYLHRELGLNDFARLLVTTGQIGLRKGLEVALAAAQAVFVRVPDVHWLVVGERTSNKAESRAYEQGLQRAAEAPPLAGRVHFLGRREDVPQLLVEGTLLVHAARQEPLGRVLLEAAACGLPVVATDVGGTREIFPSEADGGVLVPPDDAAAMAEAISRLLVDERRRAALAAGGRRRAEQAFDVRLAARRLIEQYHAVLGY